MWYFLLGFLTCLLLLVVRRVILTKAEIAGVISDEVAKHREATADISEDVAENTAIEHTHSNHCWKRGILPGQVYVKTCTVNGEMVKGITQEEWLRTL